MSANNDTQTVPPTDTRVTPSVVLPVDTSTTQPPVAITTKPTDETTPAPPPVPTTSVKDSETTQQPTKPIGTTVITTTSSNNGQMVIVTKTIVTTPTDSPDLTLASASPSSTSSLLPGKPIPATSGGLTGTTRVVVAVVVPIVGVALIAMILLFFYKKRKRDRENTEQRRKEVEDYRYNPNSTPLAGAPAGGHEEAGYDIGMKDTSTASSSLGYRGWGSTAKSGAVGGRKTSNMSSSAGSTMPLTPGFQDNTYREESIGEYGPVSPSFPSGSEGTVSGAPLMRTATAEGSVVAPMSGPNAFDNDGIHRGISNASSNYSTVTRSDHSDSGVPSGAQYEGQYYNADGGYDDGQNYSGHAYQQYQNGQPGGYPSPPVIRDVEARRNTRIETPTSSHFPQNANSGIAANF